MPLLQMGMLPGLQGSNPRAQFVSLWNIATCACSVTEAWQMPLSAGWEHTVAFFLLPLNKKICTEADGHMILLCGIIPGAALLSLWVPSPKGAILLGSK